jgi:hypothetical protein
MARITYSGIATEINGSVGGTTFQKNAYGYSVKNKANMIKPNTELQQFQKLALSVAISAWKSLSSAQRSNWDSWAATYPQYAKHNSSSVLSGFNVFVRHAIPLLIAHGLSEPLDVTPEFNSYPIDTCTIVITAAGGVLTLTPTWVTHDETLTVNFYASRPVQPSVNFIGTATRFVGSNGNLNEAINITSKYVSAYGAIPSVGQVLFIDVQIYVAANGQVWARSQQKITIT